MNKDRDFTKIPYRPLRPRSEEREQELEQIMLEAARQTLGRPDMSLQEMREMNSRKRENTIEVTFLKRK